MDAAPRGLAVFSRRRSISCNGFLMQLLHLQDTSRCIGPVHLSSVAVGFGLHGACMQPVYTRHGTSQYQTRQLHIACTGYWRLQPVLDSALIALHARFRELP